MAIRPNPGYAVLKRVEKETTTQSGLIIHSSSAVDASRATVVAVHYPEGQAHIASLGSEVVVKYGVGQPVKDEGQEFVIISVDDILAVIE